VLFLRLAWRNLWRNGRRTAIVLTAVGVGICGVVLSMAVNNGLVLQMVQTAITTEVGHLQLHARGFDRNPVLRLRLRDGGRRAAAALSDLSGVAAWAPRVRGEGLLFSPRSSAGVRVLGIDPKREAAVTVLARSLVAGQYLGDGAHRILIGKALARRLHVDVGDKLVLSVQTLAGDLTGEAFRVCGIFQTSSLEFDRGSVFVRLAESRRLFGIGEAISEIVVVAENRADISRLQGALRQRLGPQVEVQTWEEIRPLLRQTIEIFDKTAWWVYAAIFVAMVFGIANVLLMSVYERIREIGILTAIGMRGYRLVAMIVAESMMLTLVGIGGGYAGAVAIVAALHNGIDLSYWAQGLTAAGVGTRIVPVIRGYDVAVPVGIAVLTTVAASVWPALRALRFRPAEALRHI